MVSGLALHLPLRRYSGSTATVAAGVPPSLRGRRMPLYMDVHRELGSLEPDALAEAHLKDVEVQEKHGVCYHKYWFNHETGTVFCLVEGPSREACDAVHREAHGLVADELIEVEPALVDAFFGADRFTPIGAAVTPEGTPDPGCRVLLFTEVGNLAGAAQRLGDDAALSLIRAHDRLVREALPRHGGRQIRHTGEGVLACFASASAALRFARELQEHCAGEAAAGSAVRPQLRIGMTVGEPVERDDGLFGLSVTIGRRICETAEPGEILVSAAVRELAAGKGFRFLDHGTATLAGLDEPVALCRVAWRTDAPHAEAAPAAARAPALPPARRRAERLRRFVHELRRRRVIRAGVAYAAALFLLLQVAQLTFEPLGLPEWAFSFFLVLGLLGFPLILVLAWAFDFTPAGVQRTESDPA